jgi:hypothetical protein
MGPALGVRSSFRITWSNGQSSDVVIDEDTRGKPTIVIRGPRGNLGSLQDYRTAPAAEAELRYVATHYRARLEKLS